jgi:hypothetical protein
MDKHELERALQKQGSVFYTGADEGFREGEYHVTNMYGTVILGLYIEDEVVHVFSIEDDIDWLMLDETHTDYYDNTMDLVARINQIFREW